MFVRSLALQISLTFLNAGDLQNNWSMKNKNISKNGLSRREFIKISGVSSVALIIYPGMIPGNSNEESALFMDQYLPVIEKCDVLIVGGGFAGVSAARKFAKNGASVVLIERRIYLGREMTSTCRPWINHANGSLNELPELIKTCIDPKFDQPFADKTLFRFSKIKKPLENELLDADVKTLYTSFPLQLISNGNKIQGLVIGNKSGRQVILSNMVLDCTENASVVRLTDIGFESPKSELSDFTRTLEFIQIKPFAKNYIDVPAELNMKNNRVQIQQGYLGPNHYYVDCVMNFPNPLFDVDNTVAREKEAWKRSIAVGKYLFEQVPEFNDAFLSASSYSLAGIYSRQMQEISNDKLRNIPSEKVKINDQHSTDIQNFATPFENLWCINESARLSTDLVKHLLTPQGACETAVPVSEFLIKHWNIFANISFPETIGQITKVDSQKLRSPIKEKESPQKGKAYEFVNVGEQLIPVHDEVDILIVGGGSSGATAAISAAEQGKKTLVIDMNPGFGGTGTYAGVLDYWGTGNYKGFVARHIKNMDEVHQYIKNWLTDYVPWFKDFVTWNVQAKMYMLLAEIEKAGAKIIWNSIAIGTIMDGNKVQGVVVATPQGVKAIKAKITIDATGDGDVAAFGGAQYVFGSKTDSLPMWYALCSTRTPGITLTAFNNFADVRNIHDYTRSVKVGMRVSGEVHDHYPYLAPRESRHVLGDVVVTLTDHMKLRDWDDVINIHCSNCDIKGYHTSDWLRMGLIPPNYEIEIPYRAILPKSIDNILVVGKALSVSHESLATVRMQQDLENLGGIAALAAVFALDSGVDLRKIDIKEFQKQLVEKDLLPSHVINRNIREHTYTREELDDLIKQFDPDKVLHSYSDMEMWEIWTEKIPIVEVCTAPPKLAVPALEEALRKTSGKRALRISQALAMFGAETAAKTLHDEIMHQLSNDKLPQLEILVKWSEDKMPPDQAAMPVCANLIYSLGMTRSRLNIPVYNKVAEIFKPELLDDFRSGRKGLFYYIDAICYGAQLIGNPDIIPALSKLHSYEFLNKQSVKEGLLVDPLKDRLALLELILGRAIARCGGKDGYHVLIEYLDDNRAVLAEFANTALTKITDADYGKDKKQWLTWLDKTIIKPTPLRERMDG
jgi:ribulose 1,5-bisphosphate synthetase/thiazole synthase